MKTQEEIERSRDLIRSQLAKRAPRVVIALMIIFVAALGSLLYAFVNEDNYRRMMETCTAEKLRTEAELLQHKTKADQCIQELELVLAELQECDPHQILK